MVEHDVIVEDRPAGLSQSNSFGPDKLSENLSSGQQGSNSQTQITRLEAHANSLLEKSRVMFFASRDSALSRLHGGLVRMRECRKQLPSILSWKTIPLDGYGPGKWKDLSVKTGNILSDAYLSLFKNLEFELEKHVEAVEAALSPEVVQKSWDSLIAHKSTTLMNLHDVEAKLTAKFDQTRSETMMKVRPDLLQIYATYDREAGRLNSLANGKEWGRLVTRQRSEWENLVSKCAGEMSSLEERHNVSDLMYIKGEEGDWKMPDKHKQEWSRFFVQTDSAFSLLAKRQESEWIELTTTIKNRGRFAKFGAKIRNIF